MLRAFTKAILTTTLLAATASAKEKLCALPTASLTTAAAQYPELSSAIDLVRQQAIATWYTDRESAESCANKVKDLVATCDADTRVTLVVYGLPNKDCEAGYSASGINKNANDYKKWVQQLADGVGTRKALYVLEPDAVGLLAAGGCGVANGYADNVKAALEILATNPNADIYMDVGYWALMSDAEAAAIAKTVKELAAGGRLKGIALNTSNYRSNEQISVLCATFQKAYGDNSLHCIADTSRNYNTAPPSAEWCNAKFGGVGHPPTADTGIENLDYYIWIKPAGESDGACDGADHTNDAMVGPAAGAFFKDHFVELWNNGYFVKEQEYPRIGDDAVQERVTTTPETLAPETLTPETLTPETTTEVETPTPTTPSLAPVTQTPVVTTATPTPTPVANEPESDSPVANPSQVTPTLAPTAKPTPVESEDKASPTPVVSIPQTNSVPAAAMESGDVVMDSTPVPTPAKTKKIKKAKKCESGLEPLPEEEELAPAEVKGADTNSTTAPTTNDAREAPGVEIGNAPAQAANTKTDGEDQGSVGGGVMAVVVIAGVVALAIGAVAFRRRAEDRRRANSLRTPVENFGELRATPALVTVL